MDKKRFFTKLDHFIYDNFAEFAEKIDNTMFLEPGGFTPGRDDGLSPDDTRMIKSATAGIIITDHGHRFTIEFMNHTYDFNRRRSDAARRERAKGAITGCTLKHVEHLNPE